jgi:hypothetical protein
MKCVSLYSLASVACLAFVELSMGNSLTLQRLSSGNTLFARQLYSHITPLCKQDVSVESCTDSATFLPPLFNLISTYDENQVADAICQSESAAAKSANATGNHQKDPNCLFFLQELKSRMEVASS